MGPESVEEDGKVCVAATVFQVSFVVLIIFLLVVNTFFFFLVIRIIRTRIWVPWDSMVCLLDVGQTRKRGVVVVLDFNVKKTRGVFLVSIYLFIVHRILKVTNCQNIDLTRFYLYKYLFSYLKSNPNARRILCIKEKSWCLIFYRPNLQS